MHHLSINKSSSSLPGHQTLAERLLCELLEVGNRVPSHLSSCTKLDA